VYGFPSPDTLADAEAGKIHVGGCVVDGEEPHLHCKACGTDFVANNTSTLERGLIFVGDRGGKTKRVGEAIRAAVGSDGPLRLAVAYVTSDPQELLGFSFENRDVHLVCDARSGACNPFVLRKLARQGVTLSDIPGLHAKVIIADDAVVVGSVNFSSQAIMSGNIEAITVVRDPSAVRTASGWFDDLARTGTPLARALERRSDFALLVALWKKHQHGGRIGKLTLLEAIEKDVPELADYVFAYYRESTKLTPVRRVRAKAKDLREPLPPSDTWERHEDPFTQLAWDACTKFFKRGGKKLITLEVAARGGRVVRFKRLDAGAEEFVSAFRVDESLVTNFLKVRHSPFLLGGPDAATLCQRLTAQLEASPRLGKAMYEDPYWVMRPAQLRALVVGDTEE
jgi:hypothetical protein